MVYVARRCFAGHVQHRGKVEDELYDIFYELFSREENALSNEEIPLEYARIVKRTTELKRLIEFGATKDIDKMTWEEIRGASAWQKAFAQWQWDTKDDPPKES